MALSNLLQGCSNKSDTVMVKQDCYKIEYTRLQQYCYIMIATALSEQPCNKSDYINKVVTGC